MQWRCHNPAQALNLLAMALMAAWAPPTPAQAQPAPLAEVAARFATPWQGTWVGPDGRPASGEWGGDLLTPDGQPVDAAVIAHTEGTAFLLIHPHNNDSPLAWDESWLRDCYNKLNYKGIFGNYGRPGLCQGWLAYYHRAHLDSEADAFAVPVTLEHHWAAHHCCTVTTRIVTHYAPRHRRHDKRIRLIKSPHR